MVEHKRIYLDEDTRLMVRVSKEGDGDDFRRLYDKYFPVVIGFIVRLKGQTIAAEDIAQEVFCRIWKKRKQYRPTSAFKTYLLGYARIVFLEFGKSQKKDSAANEIFFSKLCQSYIDVLSQSRSEVDTAEIVLKIEKAKSKLNANQLRAVELFHNEQLSVSEASKLVGCSKKAFECRLARAHKKLRQILAFSKSDKC